MRDRAANVCDVGNLTAKWLRGNLSGRKPILSGKVAAPGYIRLTVHAPVGA